MHFDDPQPLTTMSIGEKLSLKGKLFELSKKLNLLEIESANQEECTFQPEINREYALPDRESSFDANMQRAQMIKQQKQEMLKATLTYMNEAACTFTPTLSKRSQLLADPDYISKPVGDRLYEKAAESKKNKDDLIEYGKKYDAYGNKLFSPSIQKKTSSKRPASSSSSSSSSAHSGVPSSSSLVASSSDDNPPKGRSITAGEYMYREAMDREHRHKMRVRAANAEAERGANSHKNNKKSVMILRQKAEREVRAVFEYLDENETGILTQEQLQKGVKMLCDRNVVPSDSLYIVTEQAWSVLDPQRAGSVQFPKFLAICVPMCMRETDTGSWTLDNALPNPSVAVSLSTASLSFNQPPVCSVPKNQELTSLRKVVNSLVETLKSNPELLGGKQSLILPTSFRSKHVRPDETNKTPFSPVINKLSRSKAIANRKKLLMSLSGTDVSEQLDLSALSDSSATPSAVDVLELRSRLREEKIARLRKEKEEREKKECLFRPRLYGPLKPTKKSHDDDDASAENKEDLPRYEKLYALKDKQWGGGQPRYRTKEQLLEDAKKFKRSYVQKPEVDELLCTFKPVVTPMPEFPVVSEEEIAPGYKEAVDRMRNFRAGILTEPERLRMEMIANEQRYREGRKRLEHLAPPSFLSDERILAKQEKRRLPDARLFVDVRLSANKVTSVPIIEGDNPAIIADNFCRIYALDSAAKDILEEVVRQSMELNGVRISNEIPVAGSASPLKLSAKRNVLRRSTGGDSSSSSSGSSSESEDSSDSDDDSDSSSGSSEEDDEFEQQEDFRDGHR